MLSNPLEKTFRFAPRAYFSGTLQWLCPQCGRINPHRLDLATFRGPLQAGNV